MLPFGSLLTQLPLLIIGGLYMLYLGFYAVNRTKESPIAAESEKKEHFAGYKSADRAVDYYSIASISKEKENLFSLPDGTVHFAAIYTSLSCFVPDTGIYYQDPGYCLFSRPPPSAS